MRKPAFVIVIILGFVIAYASFKMISPMNRKYSNKDISYIDFKAMKYEDKIEYLSEKLVKIFDDDLIEDREELVKQKLFDKSQESLTQNELIVKANIYISMGKFNEAVATYNLHMSRYDIKPVYYLNKAMALYKLGKVDDSTQEVERAIDLDANYANNYLIKCVLYDKIKRYDDAISFCNDALNLDKNIGDAHYQKGNIYMEIESYDEAIKEYKAAVFSSPQKIKTYERARNDAMRKFLAYRSGKFDIRE